MHYEHDQKFNILAKGLVKPASFVQTLERNTHDCRRMCRERSNLLHHSHFRPTDKLESEAY